MTAGKRFPDTGRCAKSCYNTDRYNEQLQAAVVCRIEALGGIFDRVAFDQETHFA